MERIVDYGNCNLLDIIDDMKTDKVIYHES